MNGCKIMDGAKRARCNIPDNWKLRTKAGILVMVGMESPTTPDWLYKEEFIPLITIER